MAIQKSQAAAAGAALAAVLGAAGIAADQLTVPAEGWRLAAYGDPADLSLATACAGVTQGVQLGRKYTEDECRSKTAQAMISTGLAIYKCLPETLPEGMRAAFTDFAYNEGVHAFCTSGANYAVNHGQYALACRRLNQADDGHAIWVSAGGRVMPGLVERRAKERALCERSLK